MTLAPREQHLRHILWSVAVIFATGVIIGVIVSVVRDASASPTQSTVLVPLEMHRYQEYFYDNQNVGGLYCRHECPVHRLNI